MKAFVTGSTGLLGSAVVETLLNDGHEVRALARSREKAVQILGSTPAEIVTGDIEQIDSFTPALDGVDTLFHVAAYFREYFNPGDHDDKLHRINVEGTMRLFDEAEKRGVKKIIFVSSSGVIGKRADGTPSDETDAPDALSYENRYFRSKVDGERAIADWLRTHRTPVVLILPTLIFGPRDAGPTGGGRIVLGFLRRELPGIPPGGFSVVDSRDAARAMVNAVERGRSGERYIVSSGRYYTMGDTLRLLSQVSGVPVPPLSIPYPVAMTVARLSEAAAQVTGGTPQFPVSGLKTLRDRREYSAAKAASELGFQARPFIDTLRDQVEWYRAHGFWQGAPATAAARA